jgi:hypothetical protein
MSDLHVVADERTTWRVYEGQAPAPLSEHTNATDAELAAQARAEDRGAERVVVHDRYRYHRTHDLDASPRQRQEGAQRARARQLDAARDRARRFAREQ